MSGVTLAVSPSPADTDQTTTTTSKAHNKRQPQQQRGIMGSLRVIELQLVAFIMVFSVSGLVPLLDLVFPAFVSAYILALARFAFPAHGTTSAGSSEEIIFEGNKLFRLYVVVGTTVGLFLPLAYVLGGFARGDEQAVQLATPHLFLLSFQILTENIISGMGLFSPPVRALVTLLYTVRRTFVLIDWLLDIWFYKSLPANAHLQDIAWHWFGKSLSMANLVYFSVNMLGFLIPVFLPRAFERYFKGRNEIHAKIAEDKYSTAAHKTQPVGAAVADKKTD